MEKEDPNFPFAIYRFTHDVEKLRDMAPYQSGESFNFAPTGGTDIVGALGYVVNDIETKRLAAGDSPKILLLYCIMIFLLFFLPSPERMTDVCRVLPKPMRFTHRGKLVWLACETLLIHDVAGSSLRLESCNAYYGML